MMTVAVLAEDAADGIVEEGGELLLLLLTGMLETVPGTEIPPLSLQKEEAWVAVEYSGERKAEDLEWRRKKGG